MLALWLLLLAMTANVSSMSKLSVVAEWKYFDFLFKSKAHKVEATLSGDYNYTKITPIDVDTWKDKIFVTCIRDVGVPSSLNVISSSSGAGGPLLKPYPNWDWTKINNCDGIISVYRVAIDQMCDRLWVLDTGKIGDNSICPPQLLVFDLKTDTLIYRRKIPANIAQNRDMKGLLITPVIFPSGSSACAGTNVYIADVVGGALITYDGQSFQRFESPVFQYNPDATNFTIQGESFTFDDGILGMAIAPYNRNGNDLWFSSFASYSLNKINLKELSQGNSGELSYVSYTNILPSQPTAMGSSKRGVILFGLTTETAIACVNYRRNVNKQSVGIVARDSTTLQFASGLKVKDTCNGEKIWVLTNRLQKIYNGDMNFGEINFRILTGKVKDLISNTVCE